MTDFCRKVYVEIQNIKRHCCHESYYTVNIDPANLSKSHPDKVDYLDYKKRLTTVKRAITLDTLVHQYLLLVTTTLYI